LAGGITGKPAADLTRTDSTAAETMAATRQTIKSEVVLQRRNDVAGNILLGIITLSLIRAYRRGSCSALAYIDLACSSSIWRKLRGAATTAWGSTHTLDRERVHSTFSPGFQCGPFRRECFFPKSRSMWGQ